MLRPTLTTPRSVLTSGLVAFAAVLLAGAQASAGIIVTPTTDPTTLANALGGTGLTIDSVAATNGAPSQFGTYQNFSLLHNGVVLSSGNVVDTAGPPSSSDNPATDTGQPGTPEFDKYGPGHIANFNASYDVARLQVNFTLATASAVSFKFIFGSIEYPNWVSNYTDSFVAFLDGTDSKNQIMFDSNYVPVQVGKSFSDKIVTSNTETAFGSPHGFIPTLITTTGML